MTFEISARLRDVNNAAHTDIVKCVGVRSCEIVPVEISFGHTQTRARPDSRQSNGDATRGSLLLLPDVMTRAEALRAHAGGPLALYSLNVYKIRRFDPELAYDNDVVQSRMSQTQISALLARFGKRQKRTASMWEKLRKWYHTPAPRRRRCPPETTQHSFSAHSARRRRDNGNGMLRFASS